MCIIEIQILNETGSKSGYEEIRVVIDASDLKEKGFTSLVSDDTGGKNNWVIHPGAGPDSVQYGFNNGSGMCINVSVSNDTQTCTGSGALNEEASGSEHFQYKEDLAFMGRIQALIERNLDDHQFGISQLCRDMGISRAEIYRKFKSLNDRTPHDYLRSYRLIRAKELLLQTGFNVSEVAYRTGFVNVSHFSRIFSEEFGKHPSEYKKNNLLFA